MEENKNAVVEKLSHEELKKAVLGSIGVGNVLGEVLSDGKVNLADLASAPALATAITSLSSVDYKLAFEQLKDLDKAELDDIHAAVVEKFNIPQDELEGKIELALGAVIELSQAVVKCVEVAKAFKK